MTKPLRILIVEDSEDDAVLVIRQIRRGGYNPTYERVDTEAALEAALDRKTWELVITDYSMPQFNAYGTLNALKKKGLDIPCIVVSGTIGEETAVLTMKGGASDYIMKGNLNRLIPAVERELRDAEVRRERKKAEEALRASEERYRSLVENVDIGVTLIDTDYTIIMSNAAQGRLLGRNAAELTGKKCYEVFWNLSRRCSQCPGIIAMTSGQAQEIEIEDTTGRGKRFNRRVRAFPIFRDKGEVTGCIEVVEDITERKRLEEQVRQAAQLEAIGQLAGGVAHDFNNLLTAVLGYANVLLQQMLTADPNREKVFQISRAAERASDLTRQLLAVGRKQVLNLSLLSLNSVIADFDEILRRLLGEEIELVTSLSDSLGSVKADPGQVERVLLNLAVNSRDAMPQGGTLTITTANVNLDDGYVRTHPHVRPGPYVRVSVADTGVGMDAYTCSRIFDPFFSTKESGKGTGLGLSTVYGIVKQHDGHITVHSEAGQGTAFTVYFPLAEPPEETHSQAGVSQPERGGTETILLVEDERIVRELAAEVLAMLGYQVIPAADPRIAVEVSGRHDGSIDLLITDVILPHMDGPSLFSRLAPERPGMRVLYVSGYSQGAVLDRGIVGPDVHFLQKPFTLDGLAGKVREVLDGII